MIHPAKDNKSGVLYGYAFNEDKEIVSIEDVTIEKRKTHKFFCIHCGNEMVASLKDERKKKHFRHKNKVQCDFDYYLHDLSEHLFKEAYDSAEEFFLCYSIDVECSNTSCQYKNGNCIERNQAMVLNLKEWYQNCNLEKNIIGKDGNEYRADILLTSNKPNIPPLLIEIFVTHECTESKKNSGLWIIEPKIYTEEEIRTLCNDRKIFIDEKVSLYNIDLRKDKQLELFFYRYVYNEEDGSSMKMVSCANPKVVTDENSKIEINIIEAGCFTNASEIEEYINYRYNLLKPSCDNCAYNVNNIDFESASPEMQFCYDKQGLCENYSKRSLEDVISVFQNLRLEVVKGNLPEDFKVLLYGPHYLDDINIIGTNIEKYLRNRIKWENIILKIPYPHNPFAFNIIEIAKVYSFPVDFIETEFAKYGQKAPYVCINEMLKDVSAIIAFSDDKHKPTLELIRLAKIKRIPIRVVKIPPPKRLDVF